MKSTGDAVQPSRGRRYGRSRGGMGGDAGGKASRRITKSDVLSYIKEVQVAFRDQPAKYSMFLEIMEGFKAKRIDRAGVEAKAMKLLKGHDRLIHGFKTFLPEGRRIAPDEPLAKKEPAGFEEAIGFVHKVKEYFRSEEHVYSSFLNILNTHRHGKGTGAIYNEVADLFVGHPHLIEGLKRFLPENFRHQDEFSSITTRTS